MKTNFVYKCLVCMFGVAYSVIVQIDVVAYLLSVDIIHYSPN